MADIKLFVCCHKLELIPKHPLLFPIQVGAFLADKHFCDYLHDDTGDNISEKNGSYCELTAQYWAWKNVKADYYGFFHYRRFLYPDINARLPYRIEREPNLSILNKIGYGEFADLIQKYDLIAPIGENMYVSVRDHYANAPFHHRTDLDLVEMITRERTPEISGAMEEYMSNTISYFGNIYIMRRRLFQNYCSWLFPVLEEFDCISDTKNYSVQEKRVDGYLAERLLGTYITKIKKESKNKVLEIPRVHFASTNYWRKSLINTLLPPSTYRRHIIKQFFM